jgi:hypothetical protein
MKFSGPQYEKLAEMMSPIIQALNQDDQLIDGGGSAYLNDSRKNLVSVMRHTEASLADLRIKVKIYYIELCEKFYRYESIKEQFKK